MATPSASPRNRRIDFLPSLMRLPDGNSAVSPASTRRPQRDETYHVHYALTKSVGHSPGFRRLHSQIGGADDLSRLFRSARLGIHRSLGEGSPPLQGVWPSR